MILRSELRLFPWALIGALVGVWMSSNSLLAEDRDHRPLRVFILAGQSNMQGQGVVDLDHPEYYNGGKGTLVWSMEHSASKERMRHLKDSAGNWVVRDDVFVRYQTGEELKKGGLGIGFAGYPGQHHVGLELQFGHVLGDYFDAPVLLIKTCWGGKSLFRDFRPPSAGGETGEYYRKMLREIQEALDGLPTEFPEIESKEHVLAGFVWMQGWNDMIDEQARAEYADNLVHLAHDIRTALQAPDLPMVVGELGNGGMAQPGSDMQQFRDAQERGTKRIANARFVITHDFARPADLSPNVGHGHHWFGNAESYFLIGDALGEAMKQLMSKAAEKKAADG